MKIYQDTKINTIVFEDLNIPKDSTNRHYAQFLQELEKGEAELVPYVSPAPTWAEIRALRNIKLAESDWTQLPDSPLSELQMTAWRGYRQALRDITETSETPEAVVWPLQPTE